MEWGKQAWLVNVGRGGKERKKEDGTYDCSEEGANEGEDEAPGGEVVISVSREAHADHDGNEGEVRRTRVALSEKDRGEDDGEEGCHGADDLVELELVRFGSKADVNQST